MTLFIQNDTGTAGTGSVFPNNGSTNLIAISNLDSGYNEVNVGGGSDLIRVMYAKTTTGPCPTRLNTLVNTDFPTPGGNIDIIIVPSDNGFVLNDGSAVGPGITLPPNSGVDNPANSVVLIYDTTDNGGMGVCVKREGSSAVDVQSPPSVILYNELSHAFRICTNSSLSLAASGCAASPEEHAAEVDENDMRDQLGIPHRDANDHCANVGCQETTDCCCIVATVASGSPYSAEVNALRDLRDRFFRQSEIGFDFFERLHTDYYTFSPEVSTMMVRSPSLKSLVGTYFVKPLTEMLRLIYEYSVEGCTHAELGARFNAAVLSSPVIASLNADEVTRLEQILGSASLPSSPKDESDLSTLELLLRERAHRSEFVKWALIDTLSMYLEGVRHRLIERDPDTVGLRLAEAIDAWASRMPITEVWSRLSWYDRGGELDFLARALLRTPAARSRFATRLLDFFNGDERMHTLLHDQGFIGGDTPWPN